MKLIGLILLGCVISYILILLGTVGLIVGIGILIGFFLKFYLDINEIKEKISLLTQNNGRD